MKEQLRNKKIPQQINVNQINGHTVFMNIKGKNTNLKKEVKTTKKC